MVLTLLIRVAGNSLALYLANRFVAGFAVFGLWKEFLIAGATLAVLNSVIKPLLKTLAFPVIILSLGLFTIVINAAMLWAVDYIFDFVSIAGWLPLIWATLVVTLVNIIISHKL